MEEIDVLNGIAPLEVEPPPQSEVKPATGDRDGDSPWDDFNAKTNSAALLSKYGWHRAGGTDEQQLWTRPGKQGGPSGTLFSSGVFHCFTSNAPPLEPKRGYDAWGMYVRYEHSGDFQKAAREYRQRMHTRTSNDRPAKTIADGIPDDQRTTAPPQSAATPQPETELPEFEDACDAWDNPAERPPELIEGMAFIGSKISMSSNSKGRKTWFQILLAMSVAQGLPFLGRKTTKGKVLYINLELSRFSFQDRERAIGNKIGKPERGSLVMWHLRGKRMTIEILERELFRRLKTGEYCLIIIDPIYKLLGARSENDASEMGDLLNRLEAIAANAGAAYIVAHHYSKGDQTGKNAIDRASGSGVVARDGDTIIALTEHAEGGCVTMDTIVRDFPPLPATVLRWIHPTFEIDGSLDPADLKQPTKAKPTPSIDEVLACVTGTPQTREQIQDALIKRKACGIGKAKEAFRNTLAAEVLRIESMKRKGTNDLHRYFK